MRRAEVLAGVGARLSAAGIENAQAEARWLVGYACGLDQGQLAAARDLPDDALSLLDRLVVRRAAREPLQYLLGTAPFRRLEVAVGPGVFVPRPETELLIDAVLPRLRALRGPFVVDLCAGSGALALAIADEVPNARVLAVERAEAALAWLQHNVAAIEGSRPGELRVLAADVTDPAPFAGLVGQADVVLANPPYVPEHIAVGPEVRADPPEAVFGGADGLAVIPAVLARAAELLASDGILALEHDDSHGALLPRLAAASGHWLDIADHADLAGRPRYLTARRARSAARN